MESGLTQLQRQIIAKLFLYGYIGSRHTSMDNVPKGFPKHLRGEVKREAEEAY